MVIFEAHFACHDSLKFGRSSIKRRQHPDMTIAVDMDVIKQTASLTGEFSLELFHYFSYNLGNMKHAQLIKVSGKSG